MFRKISIVLGGISIFLILAGIILDFIIYQNDFQSHQEYIMEAGVIVPVGVSVIIAVMLLFIINNLPFVGGTGMVLLGFFHILIAAGMYAEISSMIAHGPKPYLLLFFLMPQNLVTGLVLVTGGILAILAGFIERKALPQGKDPAATRRFNNPGSNP